MTESYSTFQLAKILRIPKPRFLEWVSKEFLTPSISKSNSKGTRNRFNKNDVFLAYLFMRLLKYSFSREQSSEIIGLIRRNNIDEALKDGKKYLICFDRNESPQNIDVLNDESPLWWAGLKHNIPDLSQRPDEFMIVVDLEKAKLHVNKLLED